MRFFQNLQNDVTTFLTTFQQLQQQMDTLEQSASSIQTELHLEVLDCYQLIFAQIHFFLKF